MVEVSGTGPSWDHRPKLADLPDLHRSHDRRLAPSHRPAADGLEPAAARAGAGRDPAPAARPGGVAGALPGPDDMARGQWAPQAGDDRAGRRSGQRGWLSWDG